MNAKQYWLDKWKREYDICNKECPKKCKCTLADRMNRDICIAKREREEKNICQA